MITSPQNPSAAPKSEAVPSVASTALLIVSWLVLWLAIVRAGISLLAQREIANQISLVLGEPARWLFGLSCWRWFRDYWWSIVVVVFVLAPVVGLITYWFRHRLRSPLASWAWGILLIVPPLALLAVAAEASISASRSILNGLQTIYDEPQNYFDPGRQHLRSAIKLREVRHGLAGPDGEVVVIEPAGDWRVIPGLSELDRAPLRQGKLTTGQLKLLAEHLARSHFLQWSEVENPAPPVAAPPGKHDALVIEFGDHSLSLEGVRRDCLHQVQHLELWEADSRSRFAALVLVIEDMVQEGK